jgi:aspartokinase
VGKATAISLLSNLVKLKIVFPNTINFIEGHTHLFSDLDTKINPSIMIKASYNQLALIINQDEAWILRRNILKKMGSLNVSIEEGYAIIAIIGEKTSHLKISRISKTCYDEKIEVYAIVTSRFKRNLCILIKKEGSVDVVRKLFNQFVK